MTQTLLISYVVSLLLLILIAGIKMIYVQRQINRLQKQVQELKATLAQGSSLMGKNSDSDKRQEMLEHQYELFVRTSTYRDLCLLYELRPDQVVNLQTRNELVGNVMDAFYDSISPMLENGEFQREDLFVCLMYYMGFRTRQIAACLGLTVEAIRKRKSRLRQRLEGSGFDFLLSNNSESDLTNK